jgi:hypothetical protein
MSGDRDLDALFALPPEEFTSARDALAKRLKDGGDADAAKEVKALRRPTVAAWALNRLVREDSGADALIELANELRKAQRGALSGLRGQALREGIKRRRAVVDGLTDRAVELLEAEGRGGASHREAIAKTLDAATADPDLAETVRAGRLERELDRPSGFGDVSGLVVLPSSRDEPPGEGEPKAAPKRAPREDPRVRRVRGQRDEAAEQARAAAREAVRAGERAVRAQADAEKAGAQIEKLESDLRTARRRERDASAVALEAGAAVKKAEQAAERDRKRVEDLQGRLEKLLES